MDRAGQSLIFSVAAGATNEIAPLFKLIEEKDDVSDDGNLLRSLSDFQVENDYHLDQLRELITDVGISHSTLEEVFMRVTGKKSGKVV